MILAYLKDSLHWLHLFCFKLYTFEREAGKLSGRQAAAVFLKVYLWLFLIELLLLALGGMACDAVGVTFNWHRVFWVTVKVSILLIGLVTVAVVEVAAAIVGLFLALYIGLVGDPVVGGLVGGILAGLICGLLVMLRRQDWKVSESSELTMTLIGLWMCVLIAGPCIRATLGLKSLGDWGRFLETYAIGALFGFTLIYGRPYYWPLHLLQLWRAYRSSHWLEHFRHSPVYWDETIGAPLPWLSHWLFCIAKGDRDVGLKEVRWVAASRPFQRNAAQMALVKLAAHDLRQITTVAQMAQMDETLDLLPTERFPIIYPKNKTLQRHANVVLLRVEEIVALAQDYLLRHTPNGQHKALLELQRKLQSFQQAIALIPTPTGPEFQQVAAQWQAIVNAAEVELRPRLPFENPFIAGNPLLEHEANLFKGRRDLVVKLEEAIFGQRPSLLLYGRRRTGKTSTLLNLPRLMSSQFVPVFIDCQNARWNDSDAMFCYHLTRALNDELVKRKLAEGLVQPSKNEFEQHAFTRLDEFLDELEAHSHRIGKQILLTFDEYERLEEGIGDGKLTRAVLNQIRAIVQHRERLIVLFSGSHRFEELQTVNWSDYLINVQTLYLSFLTRDEARELIEHPAPEFALGYAPGVVDRVLDLTHGQPYLVQALGSELVNLINREKRKEATRADLDVAIERVLGMADAYFENNWRDCNEQEQVVLRELVTQQVGGLPAVERQRALLGLSRKELVEQRGGQWQFTVELFGLWVKREKTAAVMALSMA